MNAAADAGRAELVAWFAAATGYRFTDPASLELAVVHRSAGRNNNERLEFLGDAVLDTVISHRLLSLRPQASEGELSRLRSVLVREQTLAAVAADLDVAARLELGPGERKSGGYRRASILADALEALLGAVFLDGGYPAAELVIDHLFATRLLQLPSDAELKDPKTRLQEWLQQRAEALPEYRVIDVRGAAHQQAFTVVCTLPAQGLEFRATGSSRRKAEQIAAADALAALE
ncbi:MAG: ribonuclease III [Pseudomonadota bacterium]